MSNDSLLSPLSLSLSLLPRRERDAANYKRGPKKKVESQAQEKSGTSTRPSQRDRRLSTSSSSEGDSDDGETSSSSDSSSSSDGEAEKESPKAPEPVKKVVEKPLSSPPMCREAAKAAGPKIASALRAQHTTVSDDAKSKDKSGKSNKVDKEKETKEAKDKDGGTKRKAEVLSDNGRVGVTISTTSLDRSKSPKSPRSPNPVGPMSPTAKIPRLAPVTPPRASSESVKEPHVTLSISLSPNGEAVARPGLDWRERSSQQPPRSLSQDEQSAKMALLSLQRGANKYSPGSPSGSPARPTPVLSPALPGESAHPPGSRETGGSLSDQENVNSNGHGGRPNNNNKQQPGTDLVTPSLDYWYRKNPLVDQIFITDVTVNLMTVL